jgi:hypothetical protein
VAAAKARFQKGCCARRAFALPPHDLLLDNPHAIYIFWRIMEALPHLAPTITIRRSFRN